MALPKLFLEDGTVATQANATVTDDPDPLVVIGEDLYENRSIGANDARIASGGSIHTLYCRAGKVVRQSELDNLLAAGV